MFPVLLRNVSGGHEVQFSEFPEQVLQSILHFPHPLLVSRKNPPVKLQPETQSWVLLGPWQTTPASSAWSQFSFPQPLNGQLINESSFPERKEKIIFPSISVKLNLTFLPSALEDKIRIFARSCNIFYSTRSYRYNLHRPSKHRPLPDHTSLV